MLVKMCEPHAYSDHLLKSTPEPAAAAPEPTLHRGDEDRHHIVDGFEVIYTLECNHSVYLNYPKIIFSLQTNIGLRTKWDGWLHSEHHFLNFNCAAAAALSFLTHCMARISYATAATKRTIHNSNLEKLTLQAVSDYCYYDYYVDVEWRPNMKWK